MDVTSSDQAGEGERSLGDIGSRHGRARIFGLLEWVWKTRFTVTKFISFVTLVRPAAWELSIFLIPSLTKVIEFALLHEVPKVVVRDERGTARTGSAAGDASERGTVPGPDTRSRETHHKTVWCFV